MGIESWTLSGAGSIWRISILMIDQIRAIDNQRLYRQDTDKLIKKIARIDSALMAKVEDCLKKVLELS